MFWNKKKDADGVVQTTAGGLKKGHWALRFVGFILMVPVNLIKVLFKKKAKRVEGVAGDAVSEDVENSNAESSVMALPAVLDSKEKTEEGQLEEGGDFQNTEPEPEEKKKMGLFGRIIWTLNIIGILYFVWDLPYRLDQMRVLCGKIYSLVFPMLRYPDQGGYLEFRGYRALCPWIVAFDTLNLSQRSKLFWGNILTK